MTLSFVNWRACICFKEQDSRAREAGQEGSVSIFDQVGVAGREWRQRGGEQQ